MKLIRFGEFGKEKPGVHINGVNYDVSGFIKDYDEMFFANGGLPHLAWMLQQHKDMLRKVPDGERLVPNPVASPPIWRRCYQTCGVWLCRLGIGS